MSQEKDEKSKGSAKVDGLGMSGSPDLSKADVSKRPHATIDGKATEIPTIAAAGAKPAGGTAQAASPASTTSSTAASAKPVAAPVGASSAASAKPAAAASTAAAAPRSASAKPAAPSGASMWLPSLISGATGAILALFGLGSLGLIGGDPQSATMADRMAALEKSLAGKPSADQGKLAAAADARLQPVAHSRCSRRPHPETRRTVG
jgi:hypothetical protein